MSEIVRPSMCSVVISCLIETTGDEMEAAGLQSQSYRIDKNAGILVHIIIIITTISSMVQQLKTIH